MAKAITMIQTRKTITNHWVLHSLLIMILALELFFSDSQALRCQYLVHYIACMPPPQMEAQLSTCLVTVKDKDGKAKPSGITWIGGVHASRKSI